MRSLSLVAVVRVRLRIGWKIYEHSNKFLSALYDDDDDDDLYSA